MPWWMFHFFRMSSNMCPLFKGRMSKNSKFNFTENFWNGRKFMKLNTTLWICRMYIIVVIFRQTKNILVNFTKIITTHHQLKFYVKLPHSTSKFSSNKSFYFFREIIITYCITHATHFTATIYVLLVPYRHELLYLVKLSPK